MVPPVPERVQELEEQLLHGVGWPAARRPHGRGRLGLGGRPLHSPRRRRRPRARRHLRAPRRRQRRRSNGVAGAVAGAGAGRRRDRARRGLPGEVAADLRAHRLLPRLLPRRPVVPQARRLRAGRDARAPGGRLELPPVPRELGVLRRLRPVPGRDHVAEALRGRGDREAHRSPRERGRHLHPRLRAGGRDRLRVDRLAALPRGEVHVLRGEGSDPGGVRRDGEAPRPQPRRGAALRRRGDGAPSAAARGPGGAAPEGGEGRHQVVRPVVRPLPLPHDHRRGPRLRGRGLGRDGVPDLHHGRDVEPLQPVAARPGARPRGSHRSRVRPPVLAKHGGLERVRGVVARRGLQHPLHGEGDGPDLRALGGAGARAADRRGRHVAQHEQRRAHVRRDPDAGLGLLSRELRLQLVPEDGPDPADARVAGGHGGDGPRDADLPRALALPPPHERRLLRGRGRGGGEGPGAGSSTRPWSAPASWTTRWPRSGASA